MRESDFPVSAPPAICHFPPIRSSLFCGFPIRVYSFHSWSFLSISPISWFLNILTLADPLQALSAYSVYSVVPLFVSIRFIRGHFRVFRLFRGFSTSSHWQSRYRHFLRILWFPLTASFCRPTSHRIKKRHLTMRDAVSERRFKLLIQQQELLLPQQERR